MKLTAEQFGPVVNALIEKHVEIEAELNEYAFHPELVALRKKTSDILINVARQLGQEHGLDIETIDHAEHDYRVKRSTK